MKRTLLMLAAATSFAAPATGQDSPSQPSERVSYAGLDLASKLGRVALEGRIRAAASRVCDVNFRRQSVAETLAIRVCYDGSVVEGIRQMDELLAQRRSDVAAAAGTLIIRAH